MLFTCICATMQAGIYIAPSTERFGSHVLTHLTPPPRRPDCLFYLLSTFLNVLPFLVLSCLLLPFQVFCWMGGLTNAQNAILYIRIPHRIYFPSVQVKNIHFSENDIVHGLDIQSVSEFLAVFQRMIKLKKGKGFWNGCYVFLFCI